MPIYAYRCEACGHTKDVLQKVSDPLLTQCPSCGVEAFQKQVTAAGFQLKGSGWYVTDFRGGDAGKAPAAPKDDAGKEGDAKGDAKSEVKGEIKGDSKSSEGGSAKPADAPASPAPPASAPAADKAATPAPSPSAGGGGGAPGH